MSNHIQSFSQREHFEYTWWSAFLWWLSTAEKELIVSCKVDRNRYKIIGASILATWSFATLSWTYFWMTITTSLLASVLLGIFMGLIILSIDRALIKGINSANKKKAGPLLIRGLLALTLGTFMAQPAILYMFSKEIEVQASVDNDIRRKNKMTELTNVYKQQTNDLQMQKNALQKQLNQMAVKVDGARIQYLSEADGSGGSGKIGINTIALAKKTEYEKLDLQYENFAIPARSTIKKIDSLMEEINSKVLADARSFEQLLKNGFLTRIEALNNLVKNNGALQWRYFLITMILILIELMPVIVKTLLPTGVYDEKVRLIELNERELAANAYHHEKELILLYNKLARENDGFLLEKFFEESKHFRSEKLRNELSVWKSNQGQPFDTLWQSLKKGFLSRQES